MAKWISDPDKGLIPGDLAAKIERAEREFLDGKTDKSLLEKLKAELAALVEKGIKEEKQKLANEQAEREAAHAAAYVTEKTNA